MALHLAFLLELNHWDLNHPLKGNGYQSWSGILSDVAEITLLGGVISVYKQHACRAHWWCPCIAKHKVDGTAASVCHFHHSAKHHRKLQLRHKRKHPDLLTHGESPDA